MKATKLSWYAALFAGTVACVTMLSCANEPDSVVCPTGIVCPSPLKCAAAQEVCIATLCGNGVVDPGEVCDDGNIINGDGCSSDCLSKEQCGNGVVDPGEVCDDGNVYNGSCSDTHAPCNADTDCSGGSDGSGGVICKPDGCSSDCKSREVCGNDIVDLGEVCDDGNTVNGACSDGTPCDKDSDCAVGLCMPDHCNLNCTSNQTCGNGIVDLGEKCDNGSANALGAACEPGCQTGSGCGNGIIDPGEECDDGNTDDNDDCVHCMIARCGDGYLDSQGTAHKEDCDASSEGSGSGSDQGSGAIESADCNANCTIPTCGDGIVNIDYKPDGVHPEQCDLGSTGMTDNNTDSAACTSTCQVAVCGDDHIESGVEDCDNGSANGTSGSAGACDITCHVVACGNGIVDPGEQCDPQTVFTDPANPIDTAACDSDCTAVYCGDNHTNHAAGEVCDQGSANGQPCPYAGMTAGQTCVRCAADCKTENNTQAAPYCGDGNTDTEYGEVCDQGSLNGTACPYATSCNRCNATCSALAVGSAGPSCGDLVIETADNEQCDGTNLGGKSCTSLGFSGGTLSCSSCRFDTSQCTAVCGDGKQETGEECDGSDLAGASCTTLGYDSGTLSCSSSCKYVVTGCVESVCGNNVAENGEECDGTALNGASCISLGYSTGTLACYGTGAGSALECKYNTSACTSVCGNGKQETGEQCDGSALNGATCTTLGYDSGAVTCNSNCTFNTSACVKSVCGNGVAEAGEECDGAALNGASCTTLGYGSGSLSCYGTAAGASLECKYNTSACTSVCGDGKQETGEQCDGSDLAGASCTSLGYAQGTLTCSASCTYNLSNCTSKCGDGIVEAGEQCDGTAFDGATCETLGYSGGSLGCTSFCQYNTASCTNAAVCGDGKLEAGEQCDGLLLDGASCTSLGYGGGSLTCNTGTCTYNVTGCAGVCGNGKAEAGEQCDGSDLDGASCETLGYGSGTLTCNPTSDGSAECTYNISGCN